MKYTSKMLDDIMVSNNSDKYISLRAWIHSQIKFTFLPDIPDETLDSMKDNDLTELIESLKLF